MYIWWNCSCIVGKNNMLLQENITNKMFSASCNILVCMLCNIIYNFSQFSIQDRGSAGNRHHILFRNNGLLLRFNCWPDTFPMQFQPKDKYKFCLKMKNYFHLDISYQQIIFPSCLITMFTCKYAQNQSVKFKIEAGPKHHIWNKTFQLFDFPLLDVIYNKF